MTLWGFTLESTLEWIAFIVFVILTFVAFCVIVWFVEKYTTGMVGGFLMILSGMAMVLGPSFSLISGPHNLPLKIVYGMTILAGCISVLIGSFSLRNYRDF